MYGRNKILLFSFISSLICWNANGAIVNKIDVTGNTRMDAESVRILTEVEVGDDLNAEDINQVAKRLQQSKYFTTVNVKNQNGVLKINLTEAPIINQITIEGNDDIGTEDLKKEIKLEKRDYYDESAIGADVQRMLLVYQRKGFFGTKILPKKIVQPDNQVNVVYEIEEGNPTYIKDIEFTGNKIFNDKTLHDEILSQEYSWWDFMSQFDVYDADRIQYDQQMLRQFYLRNGYIDFKITGAKGNFTPDRKYYSVVISMDEGEKYDFGKISIKNPFKDVPDDVLEKAILAKDGKTYNIDLVEESVNAIRSAVAEYGYAFINVNPIPKKNNKTHTVDLTFDIQKTNRVYINTINIFGNVRTFDSVIDHLLPMRAGDPFSLQTIESGRQQLMRTRYFKDVKMTPTRIANENLMNLDITVEEQPTGELSGGFGWSNINGFMVDAGITENNFMGRGQIVQLKGSVAEYQSQALFSFTDPYVFNRPLSAGFDLSYTQYNYSSLGSYGYDRDSFMASTRLGWKLTDNWTQTVRLSATFDKNYDIQTNWTDSKLYTLGTSFKYYNLDTNFSQNTHTGVVANMGVSYTGFFSTESFMRYNADIVGLVNFWDDKWQLKSSLDFGLVQPLNGDYIPRAYRYFLGGDSLRGFDVAGVGSRNWYNTYYALGGLWKANGSTQLNFPIFIPDEYQVKGFIFADYGILGKPPVEDYTYKDPVSGTTKDNYIDSSLRTSVGFGIYWNTPMGPMNFSWGYPMKLTEYDKEQTFLLSFETQF